MFHAFELLGGRYGSCERPSLPPGAPSPDQLVLHVESPSAQLKPPKVISPSDPSSAWTARANKRVQFRYGLNYLIDLEHAVIVDVEPTPARTYHEVESTKAMLDRTEHRFSLKPKRLAADTAYGTGRFLRLLFAVGPLHIFPFATQTSAMTAPFHAVTSAGISGAASTFVQTTKCCTPSAALHDGNMLRYRASKFDCDACALKVRCSPIWLPDRYLVTFTKMPAIWRDG